MVITTGTYSELAVLRQRSYTRGTILVMDRGFMDFGWFNQLQQNGVVFVTRIKTDTRYEIAERRDVIAGKGIVSDDLIQLHSTPSRKRYPEKQRLVTVETAESERLEFLTHNMALTGAPVA